MTAAGQDWIEITGLQAFGYHGVFEHERANGQLFSVDLRLELDLRPAGRSDDLADTVNYGTIAEQAADLIRGEPHDLIETLAEQIAQAALADDRVQGVQVRVHKPSAPVPETFGDIAVVVYRRQVHRVPTQPQPVVIALGSNLGESEATLRSAVQALRDLAGLSVERVSGLWHTEPVGGPEQPDYLNAVLTGTCALAPLDLLRALHDIEHEHDRRRLVHWGPRTLDLDLIAYADLVCAEPDLTLPHPRAHQRAFVLAPWAQLDASARLRVAGREVPVADLLAQAADRAGVRAGTDLE